MLVAVLLLSLPAHAKDCPWEGEPITSASATMTTVTVNGRTWSVTGRDDKERFRGWLIACQHGEAAKQYTMWRAARLGTNVSAATVIGSPYAAVSAALAGMARDDMIRALSHDASAQPTDEPDDDAAVESIRGLVSAPRPRVLAFYALPDGERIVRATTPRHAAPGVADAFEADWAPYHSVEPVEGVLERLDELDTPEATELAQWLRAQASSWVGWHLERTDPDHPERPSTEALAEFPRALVFYELEAAQGPPADGAASLVVFPPYPTLKPLDPDVPPFLSIASRAWLQRRLMGPAEPVDQVLDWLEDEDVEWVGWQWEPRSP